LQYGIYGGRAIPATKYKHSSTTLKGHAKTSGAVVVPGVKTTLVRMQYKTFDGLVKEDRKQPPAPSTLKEPSAQVKEEELAEQLVSEIAQSGTDVNTLCETYGLRREELGRLTGFSLRALAEWSSGKLPSQPAKRRLHETRRLLDALAEIVKRESIPQWLHASNPAFDRLTPLQVIELGEIDRLWAMVHDMASGQPE
jgi:DNA-binding transcriptional regulator YiaG